MKTCDCLERVNESLRESEDPKVANSNVTIGFRVNIKTGKTMAFPKIQMSRVEARGPGPITMFPTYCPFCGEKYGEEK